MMSFLGALLMTGLVVLAIGGVLYLIMKVITSGSTSGDSRLGLVIGIAVCVAVSILPAGIFRCLVQGEGGAFTKLMYVFSSTVELLKEAFEKPSLWDHIIMFAPMIVGGFIGIGNLEDDGPALIWAPLLSLGAALGAFVVAAIAAVIAELIEEIKQNPENLLENIAIIAIIAGLVAGGGTVITITIKD